MLLDAPVQLDIPVQNTEATNASVRTLSTVSACFLTLELLLATSADYLWYGPLPAWLLVPLLGFPLAVLETEGRAAFALFLRRIAFPIILPWLLFMISVTAIDTMKGFIEGSVSSRVFLNGAGLVSMVMTGFWASRVRPRTLVYMLALIASLQAVVSVAQYSGNSAAWNTSLTIISVCGARFDKALGGELSEVDTSVDFGDIGRVKGTALAVHKFTPMASLLCAFLAATLFMNYQSKNQVRLSTGALMAGAVLAALCMFLTFSRSAIYGNAALVAVLLLLIRRFGTIFVLGVVLALGYFAGTQLKVQDARQFERLADVDTSHGTNAGRVNQYSRALGDFAEHPLVGHPIPSSQRYDIPIHSVILRVMADYGIVGTFFYLGTIFGLLRVLWVHRNLQGGETRVIAQAASAAILVALLDSWTHSSGLLVKDVLQPILYGAFLGGVLCYSRQGGRIQSRARIPTA